MTKKRIPPLEFEIVQERSNLLYLSVIEYKRSNYLSIIDNVTPDEITAFVLDYVQQEGISIRDFLSMANLWYYKSSSKYPLSVELAKHGFTERIAPMVKTFDISYVSRVVGYPFSYNLIAKKVKRRRVAVVPECVEIKLKKS